MRHWADFACRMVNAWLIGLRATIPVHPPLTKQIRENTDLVGENSVAY